MRVRLCFVILLSFSTFLQAAPSRLDQLEGNVKELQTRIDEINDQLSSSKEKQELLDTHVLQLTRLIEASNSSINNSLDASSRFLTIVSIVIALLGVAVAGYVTYLSNKVKAMVETIRQSGEYVSNINKEVSIKQKEVSELVDEVNNNIGSLYSRIRREDTKAFLNRLIEVPEDINNIIELLSARNLESEDFFLLRQAYLKLLEIEGVDNQLEDYSYSGGVDGYLSLFFQHFLGLSIEDDLLRDRIIGFFSEGLSCAFQNDIDNEIDSLGETLSKEKLSFDKVSVLSEFINALKNEPKTKDNPNYFQRLREKINDSALWEQAENASQNNESSNPEDPEGSPSNG